MNIRADRRATWRLLPAVGALVLTAAVAGCSDDEATAPSPSPTVSASASVSDSPSPSDTASPSAGGDSPDAAAPGPVPVTGDPYQPPGGLAEPAEPVTAAAKGASSAECKAMGTLLSNVNTIGNKAYAGAVEQADVDRAFDANGVAGVPADAMPYVDTIKALATKMPGMDVVAASTLFGEWNEAYNALNSAATKVCS